MYDDISKYTNIIVNYCKNNFDLKKEKYIEEYKSMAICIIDCIYSLRAKYYSVTVPIIERYAKVFMNNDKYASNNNLKELINNIDNNGGPKIFAENILKNKQQIGGRLKSEVCYDLSKRLLSIGINTIADFNNYENKELLDNIISSVKGIGDAGKNYLYMLTGDQNKCKPDVHIHHFLIDVCGRDFTNIECQIIFQNIVKKLKQDYSKLTVRSLDNIVWEKYQSRNRS